MNNSVITFSAASVLLISLIIIGTFKTGIVSALTATTTDATSTASDTMTASTSPTSASSMSPTTDASSTSPTAPAQAQTPDQSQAQSQPSNGAKPTLKLVHVVGTKYVDYFTDGTKTYSFPGNPDIDSNLNKPNAPIPTLAILSGSPRAAGKPTTRPAVTSNPAITRKNPTAHTSAMSPPTPTQTQPPAFPSRRTSQPRKPTQPRQPTNNDYTASPTIPQRRRELHLTQQKSSLSPDDPRTPAE